MSEREKGKYVDGKKKESNKITGGETRGGEWEREIRR